MNGLVMEPSVEPPFPDLRLKCVFGPRVFELHLSNPAGLTTADLARGVQCETGIDSHKQRLMFKGIIFDPPDTDVWAPRLDELNLRNGDRVEILTSPRIFDDQESIDQVEVIEPMVKQLEKERSELMVQVDRIQRGFKEAGNEIMALTYLRKDFDDLKTKFMKQIQALNALTFDHRNAKSQGRRLQLVELAQRQIDKCSEMSDLMFHSLAQSHFLANSGKLFPVERRIMPSNTATCAKPTL